jgi:phosphoribosylpyrophosphate synthetase
MTSVSFQSEQPGPLLAELLEAQRCEERAVAYPAFALIERCEELGDPIVWPVGAAAERIAGAASVMAAGALNVATWNMSLAQHRVLLIAVVGTTPITMVAAAEHVKQLGAAEVHACAVDVVGAAREESWATFTTLRAPTRQFRVASTAAG